MERLCTSSPGPTVADLLRIVLGESEKLRALAWKVLRPFRLVPEKSLIDIVVHVPTLRAEAWEKAKREFELSSQTLVELAADIRVGSLIQADAARTLQVRMKAEEQENKGRNSLTKASVDRDPDTRLVVDSYHAWISLRPQRIAGVEVSPEIFLRFGIQGKMAVKMDELAQARVSGGKTDSVLREINNHL